MDGRKGETWRISFAKQAGTDAPLQLGSGMPSPLSLILETSTPLGSVALVENGEVLEQRSFSSDRSHNAMLFGPLTEMMAARGDAPLGLVLVGSGPGSYSGTRVGIAAAQGVAIASGCAAVAVPSILAVPCVDGTRRCLAIGDARRGSYWTALIGNSDLLQVPELTDLNGLVEKVKAAFDQGAEVFSLEEPSRFPLGDELRQRMLFQTPDAGRLWKAWSQASDSRKSEWSASPPQPMYLKPPHITPGKKTVWF